jgi:hypothetical protein
LVDHIRRKRDKGHAAQMGRRQIHTGFSHGNVKEKKLRRPPHRWNENIKIDLKIGWKGMNWTNLVQEKSDRLLQSTSLRVS